MTQDLHALVREEFQRVRLTDTLDDVTARGLRVRRRRRSGSVLSAVFALALASGVALSLPPGRAEPDSVRLAAWSVRTEPDGTLQIVIRDLADPDGLTAELKRAGVPALIEFKEVEAVTEPGRLAPHCADDGEVRSPLLLSVMVRPTGTDKRAWAIRPDAMPPGTSMHFVIFSVRDAAGKSYESVHMSLVDGDPVPCRSVS
ncbi:hypothetical protein [Catenuloplanes japonicus]|uniref:hypothetical protein n=1 Tax=Catenuloplanes japonicus TaxID=33876 RepID=UPI0012F83C47|nr:hypothetical protein [Catenuloplanes japonicus]